jgi:hypothetical protein
MGFLGDWIMELKNNTPQQIQHLYRQNDSIETYAPKPGMVCLHANLNNFDKDLSIQYKYGRFQQILIENIEDTLGMELFCKQIHASRCRLFRGLETLDYGNTEPDQNYPARRNYKRVNNWILLVDLGVQKIEKPEIVLLDSTAYYREVLINSLFNYEYGWNCGEGGNPPLGRQAFYYLVKKKAFDPLPALATIDNDEGFMYVVEYLMHIQPGFTVSPALQLRKIATCEDCTGWENLSAGKIIKQLNNPETGFGYGFMDDKILFTN